MDDDIDATEYVFFGAVGLLAFLNCAKDDGFFIGLFCGAGGLVVAACYYMFIRLILEATLEEEKGKAVARKALEVVGLAIVMAVMLPLIVG